MKTFGTAWYPTRAKQNEFIVWDIEKPETYRGRKSEDYFHLYL